MRNAQPLYFPQPSIVFNLWGQPYVLTGPVQRLASLASSRYMDPLEFRGVGSPYDIVLLALAQQLRCDLTTAERLASQVAPAGTLVPHSDRRVLLVLTAQEEFRWLVLRAGQPGREPSVPDFLASIAADRRAALVPDWPFRAWAALTDRVARLAGRRGPYNRRDLCRLCREHIANPHAPTCRYADPEDRGDHLSYAEIKQLMNRQS
ncbi:hypothetical protein [Micromonospora sp. RV43]|uniref:hypothetical protein n=1 Tax=Micromonospora sp. RV43 TaxID=1661387 RepID=UPI00064BE49C|nr:hypothetical protein [Micromonospora sp. RV43]